jgi:predicted RND superfamily exporter protein
LKTLRDIIVFIIRFRLTILLILGALVALSAYQTFKKLRVDNSLGIWFLDNNPSYRAYIDYQKQYGSDEIFVGMVPVDNALDSTQINNLSRFHEAVDSLWFVKTSFSLARAQYPVYANDQIRFEPLYDARRSERGLQNLIAKLPDIAQQLVTKDYKNLFFYVQMRPTPSIETNRDQIAGEIRQVTDHFFDHYYLTGAPVLNEAYSKGIYKESLVFGVLTILVIGVMLLFLLPSKRYLIIALLAVVTPITLLFGLITTFGFALNMISMLIPTILMVYSVSDAVHIVNIYHKEGLKMSYESRLDLLTMSIRRSFTPCFYTTLTTLVGYFALYLSPLPAFKEMGILTCLGLLLSFTLVYLITIIGFSFMNIDFKAATPILQLKKVNQSAVIEWLNRITTKRRRTIIIVSTMILLFGLYSVVKVRIDTDSLDLLAEGPAKEELRIVEQHLESSSRLQLNITAKQGSMLEPSNIRKLERFQDSVASISFAAHPVSVINLKRFLEKRSPILFQSNITESEIKSTMKQMVLGENDYFSLISDDLQTTGMVLGVKEIKTSELESLLSDIETKFKEQFDPTEYELKINGFSVVFSQLNRFILETQFKSFFAAFFVGFLCLLFFIRNLRTTILVLIPNVLPLAILAIFMSLLDIPLDVSTAMITPIMLGIAMDDTIHLVYKYRPDKTIKGSPRDRMDNAMRYTGSALFSTTIALVAGFLIISSSAVPSVRDFGLLCAITVAIALLTDIIYLPALLKQMDR